VLVLAFGIWDIGWMHAGNLMGDGAFGMSGTDIETAARSGFAITTVLVNNSSMATYAGAAQGAIGAEARQFPTTGPSSAADGQQPTTRPEAQVPSTAYGVSMMNGDYATIAQGMGAVGITCTKVSEVGPALVKARELNAAGTTCLIQVQANVEERRSNNFKFADGVDSGELLPSAIVDHIAPPTIRCLSISACLPVGPCSIR
jgi:thiamine pyrophosphate-dependent acetolactate synthase large subunit-like protein